MEPRNVVDFSVKERRVSHFNLKMFSAISFPIANSVDKN